MNNRLIQNYKIITLCYLVFLVSLFFTYSKVQASIISIDAPTTVSEGQRISVDVLIDPQSQSINSIESTVIFSSKLFNFNGFSAKQSSIPIWVEEPKEKEKGSIHFSGVIPGGIERLYDPLHTTNTSIPIVRLFFIAKTAGSADFTIGKSLVLENDGKGTETDVTSKGISINVKPNDGLEKQVLLAKDEVAPKPFGVTIIERSVFGKTPRLAVFSAEDTDGAIEYYEVAVGNLGFQKTTSPFPLPYRLFAYTLTARAYDYSGNFQEQQITIPGEKPYGLGVIIGLLLLGFIGYSFYNRIKKT